jgi:hypothetical protein
MNTDSADPVEPTAHDRLMKRLDSVLRFHVVDGLRDELEALVAKVEAEARAVHPDAGNLDRNHYDWFMPDNPTESVDANLDAFEAKMREALTDPFVHDMAHSVLPLIEAYRLTRSEARTQPSAEKPAVLSDAVEALAEALEQTDTMGFTRKHHRADAAKLIRALPEGWHLTRTDQPAQSDPDARLGRAWHEAEAALPEGWYGPIVQPEVDVDGKPLGAWLTSAFAETDKSAFATGATPAEALVALTALLREAAK